MSRFFTSIYDEDGGENANPCLKCRCFTKSVSGICTDCRISGGCPRCGSNPATDEKLKELIAAKIYDERKKGSMSPGTKRQDYIWDQILDERERQEGLRASRKFSETCASPAMADLKKLAILAEEFGEVAKEVCEYEERPSTLTREKLQAELVQVAAVCVAWLEALQK